MTDEGASVRTADLLAATRGSGAIWSTSGEDMQVNVLAFDDGEGVAEHVNPAVDVLYVVLQGGGVLSLNGVTRTLSTGDVVYVPRGSARSTRAAGGRLSYLTCHRRRQPLQISPIR